MSATFREAFNQDDIDIMIKALIYYKNRCLCNATRKIQGYGTARELTKREEWKNEHDNVEIVLSKIVEETT